MKFYAAFHNYDVRFCNDIDFIVRFTTKAARDRYVENDTCGRTGNYHREAIMRDHARVLFPDAFKLLDGRDATSGVYDARDWQANEDGVEFFGGENAMYSFAVYGLPEV